MFRIGFAQGNFRYPNYIPSAMGDYLDKWEAECGVVSKYAEPYAADSRKLFKVGVVFSSEKKNITEWEVV